jgi:NADH:ubiquinone oxidoreductase subunit K
MSEATIALPLPLESVPEKPKPEEPKANKARARVETVSHVSSLIGLADAGTHLGKVATVVEKGINTGATNLARVAAKRGWYKLAGWFLKIAAAAPLAAKIAVGIAVVAVAVTIYYVVRAA